MRNRVRIGIVAVVALLISERVWAAAGCRVHPLTAAQMGGFDKLFTPWYSPNLSYQGGGVSHANMSKQLTAADLRRLEVSTPVVVKETTLTAQQASDLKWMLNSNATATVPGWVSTVFGIAAPAAWVGVAADVFLQVVNGAGDTGRLTLANLAGTVSTGGLVGVTERVAKGASGQRLFLWTYLYQARLNNQIVTTPLAACLADVVVGP